MKESPECCATNNASPAWRSSAEIVKSITDKHNIREKNARCKQDKSSATDNIREETKTNQDGKYLTEEQEQ